MQVGAFAAALVGTTLEVPVLVEYDLERSIMFVCFLFYYEAQTEKMLYRVVALEDSGQAVKPAALPCPLYWLTLVTTSSIRAPHAVFITHG